MTMTRRKSLAVANGLPMSAGSSRKRSTPTPRTTPLHKRQQRIASAPNSAVKRIVEIGEPDEAVVEWSAAVINDRAKQLFPEEMELGRPCVSARIFACFDINLEQHDEGLGQSSRPGERMSEILSLLRTFVDVEVVSLGPNRLAAHKKIHFSGVCLSSTSPPVDRVDGSDSHQQESLEALVSVKEELDTLQENCKKTLAYQISVARCLKQLRDFLKEGLEAPWLAECAKAVDDSYSPRRVSTASRQYCRDMGIVLERLDNHATPPLLLEERLAELVGQAIRYRLRMFFNGPPIRLGPADTTYEERIAKHSKVHSLFDLVPEDEEYVSSLVSEKWVSGLVSLALCRLNDYFGLDQLLNASSEMPELPDYFCASPPSVLGIHTRGPAMSLSDEELDQVKIDIDQAASFLAAARACRFLVELWSWPGVQEEIQRQGGWSEIETYASWSWKYALWKQCLDDVHLVVLCNFSRLLDRLRLYKQHMDVLIPSCAEALEQLSKRFHLTTKSKNLLHKFPQIPVLAERMEEGRKCFGAFPFVQEPYHETE